MTEAPRDRLNTIHREMRQVDNMIRQLQEKHAMLLQRLNDEQASTRALSPEILSLIFEHARPQDGSFYTNSCCLRHRRKAPYSVLTFSHVSSHWRQIVWSTPQLWTDMDVYVREKNAESIFCILELHLQNVRGLPFNLTLKFTPSGPEQNFLVAIQPIKLLLDNDEYSRKVQILHLSGAAASWASSISSKFSRLEHLKISRTFDSHIALNDSIPLLRHVSLCEMYEDISIPGLPITRLDLGNVPINICAKLLTQCPSLTRFGSANPRDETTEFHPPTSTIVLHHLQELFWSYHDSPSCLAVLEAIKLPALHTLTWLNEGQPALMVEPPIRALLADRLDTLLTLELSILEWTPALIKHVFNQCHRIQSLRLLEHDIQCLDEVLDVLLLGWDGDGTRYLPSLASLTIDSESKLDGHEVPVMSRLPVDCSHRLSELCIARGTGRNPDSRFKLHLDDVLVDWPSKVQEELCELVRNGSQLDIFVCGERESWLP